MPRLLALSLLAAAAVTMCTLGGCTDDAVPGCTKDDDCRAGRICIDHACGDPASNNGNNGVNNGNNGVNNGNNGVNNGNNGVNNGNNGVNNGNNGVNNGNNGNNGTAGCARDADCDDEAYCDEEGSCSLGCRFGGCEAGFCDPDTRECTELGCDDDQDCGMGAYCDDGECTEGCSEGTCPDGQYCEPDIRQCLPDRCNGDNSCPEGTWCESDEGVCLPGCREGSCGPGEFCELDSRECRCNADDACADTQYCEDDAGECVEGCRVDGCGQDEVCDLDSRECVGAQQCEGDGDCDDTRYCDDGTCRTGCRDGGCDEGDFCDLATRECTPEPLGPQIDVQPVAIDFGEVGLNNSAIEELTLTNVGDATLVVTQVVLQTFPSQGFDIIPPGEDGIVFLEPGDSAIYRVRLQPTFLPPGRDEAPYNNTVIVRSNDADDPSVSVPLAGIATADPASCLVFEPRNVDFGYVAPNNAVARTLGLRNCGQDEVTVTGVALSEDVDAVTIAVGGFPRTLTRGQSIQLSVTYAPVDSAGFRTTLVARTLGDIEAVSLLSAVGSPANGARIELTWDSGDDLDLHLIREEDGEFSPLGTRDNVNANDCYFANTNPDWGRAGDASDNPLYYVDDDSFGPETIALPAFEDGGRYLVVVRFARNLAFGSPDLTLRVYSAGQLATYTVRLNDPEDLFAPVIIESDGALTPNQ